MRIVEIACLICWNLEYVWAESHEPTCINSIVVCVILSWEVRFAASCCCCLSPVAVKGVNFFGLRSEYVVSGSDCGHVFLWDRETTEIVQCLHGDNEGVVSTSCVCHVTNFPPTHVYMCALFHCLCAGELPGAPPTHSRPGHQRSGPRCQGLHSVGQHSHRPGGHHRCESSRRLCSVGTVY